MSELIQQSDDVINFRWKLMTTVSAIGLATSVTLTQPAEADDANRPTVWIELGGQLERVDGGLERFAPSFISQIDTSVFTSPLEMQRSPRYASGLEGKLSFQPKNSDWLFSAAVRYGRSNSKKMQHQQSQPQELHRYISLPAFDKYQVTTKPALAMRYTDAQSQHNESHTVLDFQVGKDVGVGLFGRDGTSVFSAGVRFAQFASKSAATIGADPDFHVSYKYASVFPPPLPPITGHFKTPEQFWHQHRASAKITRSFHGVGPSISWNASATVAGNAEGMSLVFDWGLNGALLFGKQNVAAHHETDGSYRYLTAHISRTVVVVSPHLAHSTTRTRSVTVPNVGGFASFSLKFPNAKISLGYRADTFFGAVDGGIDTRKTYDRAFYGPFATVSFGLGG